MLLAYMSSGWRRPIITIGFVCISLVIIGGLVRSSWSDFQEYDRNLQLNWLLAAITLFFIDFAVALAAWHLLIKQIANYNDWWVSTKIVLYANLARRIPGTVWYIASRALMYEKVGISKTSTSLLSALEMILFLISGSLVALISLPFWQNTSSVTTSQLALLLIIIPVGLFSVHPSILKRVWQFLSKTPVSQDLKWSNTITWLVCYLLTWLLGGTVLYSAINIFQSVPISQLMMVIGIWAITGVVSLAGFLTFSLFGVREISLIVLLSTIIPTPLAILVTVIIRLIWLGGELLGALLSLKM